jgi:hypothetical protein
VPDSSGSRITAGSIDGMRVEYVWLIVNVNFGYFMFGYVLRKVAHYKKL